MPQSLAPKFDLHQNNLWEVHIYSSFEQLYTTISGDQIIHLNKDVSENNQCN